MLRKVFGLWRPMCVVFDSVPGAGSTNDPGITGGGDQAKAAGGGQTTPKPDSYELTVDGEKRAVTLDEMKALAQKSAGADKRFTDAADLRKQAENGLRIQSLIERVSGAEAEPSETEIKELATLLGIDATEFMQYLGEDGGNKSPQGSKKSGGGLDDAEFDRLFSAKLGMSPADTAQQLAYNHQQNVERARQEIRKISDEAVDKDVIFGKMIVGENKVDRITAIKEMVAEDVLRRIQDGTPFGADLVAASTQKVRAYLEKVGIPGNPAQYPINLGLMPGAGLPAEVMSEKPIQRVNAAEDGDESNFVSRLLQKGLKMARENVQRRS